MILEDARTPQRPGNTRLGRGRGRGGGAARRQRRDGTARRRNRRADQFCVHLVADERQIPMYAVEFKAPHKVTIPELVAGLHPMDLARDVIDQEGETFGFYATRLVAAVVTQIFSSMIDSGADDEVRLHRTAIGQVLAFTLQALAVEPPTQHWHDVADDQLTSWKVEYLDVLRGIPETLRKDPPVSNYRPSHWIPDRKIHDTRARARARCQPGAATPKHSSTEGSGSDQASHSPSAAAASRIRSSRAQGNHHQSTRGGERTRAGRDQKQTSRQDGHSTRPYCTMACIRGLANREPLDQNCPYWELHGGSRHSIGPQEFTRQLHCQLARDRELGFEQLHVCGRTEYLIKATLLSRGYTVILKATTVEKQHRLQTEVDNYRRLRNLQGQYIPVCLGDFKPRFRDNEQCECGATETVVHVLIDCPRLSALRQELRQKIGGVFNNVSDMLGGVGQGKEVKLEDATQNGSVLGAVLDFAEASQRFRSRAPRGRQNRTPGNGQHRP
ncbi:hypothetical protein AKAW_11318 [Aspergillus luchuensis IFO 4308]|nr:hypothetical protein AKAW_11318 [Aspergillus luchuensis IFO 4308]